MPVFDRRTVEGKFRSMLLNDEINYVNILDDLVPSLKLGILFLFLEEHLPTIKFRFYNNKINERTNRYWWGVTIALMWNFSGTFIMWDRLLEIIHCNNGKANRWARSIFSFNVPKSLAFVISSTDGILFNISFTRAMSLLASDNIGRSGWFGSKTVHRH